MCWKERLGEGDNSFAVLFKYLFGSDSWYDAEILLFVTWRYFNFNTWGFAVLFLMWIFHDYRMNNFDMKKGTVISWSLSEMHSIESKAYINEILFDIIFHHIHFIQPPYVKIDSNTFLRT